MELFYIAGKVFWSVQHMSFGIIYMTQNKTRATSMAGLVVPKLDPAGVPFELGEFWRQRRTKYIQAIQEWNKKDSLIPQSFFLSPESFFTAPAENEKCKRF